MLFRSTDGPSGCCTCWIPEQLFQIPLSGENPTQAGWRAVAVLRGCGTSSILTQHMVPWQMPSASCKPLAHVLVVVSFLHSPLAMYSLWITTCKFWRDQKLLVLKANIQSREELSKECKWRSSISADGSVTALSVTQAANKDKMKYQHAAGDSTSHWHTDELGACWFQSPGHIPACQDGSL